MIFSRLLDYTRSYVTIVIEGGNAEKFVNICARRNIALSNLRRDEALAVIADMEKSNFRKIKPIAKKANCKVRIKKKFGVGFFLAKYRRRKAFVAGIFLFVIIFNVLASLIWSVEVTGNQRVPESDVVALLEAQGIRTGIFKYRIDTKKVAENIMMKTGAFAWINISVCGTKVKVNVAEVTEPPAMIPKGNPCDIVASKDGIIISMTAKAGQEMVKTGDTVKKGQVLVSGCIDIQGQKEKKTMVHSIAEVMARTWYQETRPVQEAVYSYQRTGKHMSNFSLIWFKKNINLFHRNPSYKNYDRIENAKEISIGEDFVFPFGISIEKFYETNKIEQTIEPDTARFTAVDDAAANIIKKIPKEAEIGKRYVNFVSKEDGSIIADVVIECVENIGIEATVTERTDVNDGTDRKHAE